MLCSVCSGACTVSSLVMMQHAGSSTAVSLCRSHWTETEVAYEMSKRNLVVKPTNEPEKPCPICTNEQTIEYRTWLEHKRTEGLVPVCRYHLKKLEECRVETARIRTPPVIVELSGLSVSGQGFESS